MSKKIVEAVLKRVVDTESVANATNASTGIGATLVSIGGYVALMPEPNSQIIGGIIGALGLLLTAYTNKK